MLLTLREWRHKLNQIEELTCFRSMVKSTVKSSTEEELDDIDIVHIKFQYIINNKID